MARPAAIVLLVGVRLRVFLDNSHKLHINILTKNIFEKLIDYV